MKEIAKHLLLGIEPRGQDATGMAWFGQGNGLTVDKLDIPASAFTSTIKMNDNASTAVLHTRMATTGLPSNNKNNHPIVTVAPRGERIAGTHNGWVNNYATLSKRFSLARRAEVDSEVIFAMLQKFGDDYDKLGQELDGNYAIAYLRENRPGELFLLRGHTSPLILMQTDFGWFYASTEFALRGIQDLVGGPMMGYLEVSEGRALRFSDGEFIVSTSFDLRSRWTRYYGNRVHVGTPAGVTTSYDINSDGWDDDYWRGYRSNHTDARRWQKDPVTGVFRISGDDSKPDTNSTLIGAYTDTKRGVRVYTGTAAEERISFLCMKSEDQEYPSAYGKYIRANTRNKVVLEFHPWPGMSEHYNTDESVLEDLLFLTYDKEESKVPDTIRLELSLLNGRLDRMGGKTTTPDLQRKRNGVVFSDGWAVEHGKVIDPDGNVMNHDNLPGYCKIGGVWWYAALDASKVNYVMERSAFQADSDHLSPRAIAPPAARTADGEGVADYCLIGEDIWGQEANGEWAPLGLKADELSTDELFTLGLSFDPLADDDTDFTDADQAEVHRMVNQMLEQEEEQLSIEARKVG